MVQKLSHNRPILCRYYGFVVLLLPQREVVTTKGSVLFALLEMLSLCYACHKQCCCCHTGMQMARATWVEAGGAQQVPHHACAAGILNRLLKRNPPPIDPTQPLPTPTAAVWEKMQDQVKLLLEVQDFFGGLSYEPSGSEAIWQSLRQDLSELPYNMVAGHLPDMNLDVTELMR